MKTRSQFDLSHKQNILIQGPSGTGKTTLALQFPKPYLIDVDNNLSGAIQGETLKGVDFKWDCPFEDKTGKVLDASTLSGKQAIEMRTRELLEEAFSDPDTETVILDGATSVSGFMQGRVLKESNKSKMEIQHWDQHGKMWVDLINICKARPKRFILIAHEEMDKDELDGGFKRMLLMQGTKIRTMLPGMFSDCWETYLECKPGKDPVHMIRVKQDNRVTGLKASHPAAKPVFTATWDEVRKLINE